MSVSMREISGACASLINVTRAEMAGPRRHRRLARARQVAMYLAREQTGASYPEIGRCFGGRHHATVLYGIKQVKKRLAEHEAQTEGLLRRARELQGLRLGSPEPSSISGDVASGGSPPVGSATCNQAQPADPILSTG